MRGFTLIETLLVISLVGVLSGAYIVYSGNLDAASLDGLSQKVTSDIRYAQQLSTVTGVNHGIYFDRSQYYLYRGTTDTIVDHPMTHQSFIQPYAQFSGVSLLKTYQVEFNSSGMPIINGPVDGTAINYLQWATSSSTNQIYIHPGTGAVEIDRLGRVIGCTSSIFGGLFAN